MKKNKKLKLVVLGAIFILLIQIGWLIKNKVFKIPPELVQVVTTSSPPLLAEYYSQLDGTTVSSTEKIIPKVLGVVIDNHPDARPAAGITIARVVYEVPVEGGLTRFFSIFSVEDDVKKVGPVRSARPYFLDWLSEYGNSSFWHAGGSPEALELIKRYKVWDVNHFAAYFWRSSNRLAPHNLYTSSELWSKYFDVYERESEAWEGWQFGPLSDKVSFTNSKELEISYGSKYHVSWKFSEEEGVYIRSINGSGQSDEGGNIINASTVVVQEMDVEIVDEEGRRRIGTIGEGKARILRDGKLIRGKWKKPDRSSRTLFYDELGNEISLKPGKIWIQIVPQNTPIEVSS